MYRRKVLATGALALAFGSGCLGFGGDGESGTSGNDDEPIDADPGALLLTVDQVEATDSREWRSEGRVEEDRPLMYRDADAVGRFEVEQVPEQAIQAPAVLNAAWVHDTVEAARSTYENNPSYSEYAEEEGSIDISVGVDSMARTTRMAARTDERRGEWLFVLFRDANVVGSVSYRDKIRTDKEKLADVGTELASKMHGTWRE